MPTKSTEVPFTLLAKIANRRRRLVRLQREGLPAKIINDEQRLLDRVLDEYCAWAEEHAPNLFYTER